jgi:hypothetical protein
MQGERGVPHGLSMYEIVTTPAVNAGETQHVMDAVRGRI